MSTDWIASLDPVAQAKAQRMIEQMQAMGLSDAESWVRSEIDEDIPQLARFLVLRHFWSDIDEWCTDCAAFIKGRIAEAERDPKGFFADAGLALKRMMDAGVAPEDVGSVMRLVAYESVFAVLSTIDEGCDPEASEDMPNWALAELTPDGNPTGRYIQGLHESILSLDPSGREGCPA